MKLRLLLACSLVPLGTLVTVSPAQAAAYTSTGERCTIVGTVGDDVLTGTESRDVICGRGGNDRISGRGGSDLIDGGYGSDTIAGGYGADTLVGGSGTDRLVGGPAGDVLYGGLHGDTLLGGSGADRLLGQDGNDDLIGGLDVDGLAGGAGTNWCTVESGESRTGCLHDTQVPTGSAPALSRTSVDVTDADRRVTLSMRLTDDTGVETAEFRLDGTTLAQRSHAAAHLVSGTPRDGIWSAELRIPRYVEPGTWTAQAQVQDRVRRAAQLDWYDTALEVADANPDLQAPRVVWLVTPDPAYTVDVRTGWRHVPIRARLADNLSGVSDPQVCILHPAESWYESHLGGCSPLELTDGTIRDGYWEAVVTIDEGMTGGDWNVVFNLSDRANQDAYWAGPDVYAQQIAANGDYVDPRLREIPGDRGRFRVLGSVDNYAPQIVGLTASPSTVSTATTSATITVTIHAKDVEGVRNVAAYLMPRDSTGGSPFYNITEMSLVSGTRRDGYWRRQVTLPQGSPTGDWVFTAWVSDATHSRDYASASHPQAGTSGYITMGWDPKVHVL